MPISTIADCPSDTLGQTGESCNLHSKKTDEPKNRSPTIDPQSLVRPWTSMGHRRYMTMMACWIQSRPHAHFSKSLAPAQTCWPYYTTSDVSGI